MIHLPVLGDAPAVPSRDTAAVGLKKGAGGERIGGGAIGVELTGCSATGGELRGVGTADGWIVVVG